jgi:hypothetical protein
VPLAARISDRPGAHSDMPGGARKRSRDKFEAVGKSARAEMKRRRLGVHGIAPEWAAQRKRPRTRGKPVPDRTRIPPINNTKAIDRWDDEGGAPKGGGRSARKRLVPKKRLLRRNRRGRIVRSPR